MVEGRPEGHSLLRRGPPPSAATLHRLPPPLLTRWRSLHAAQVPSTQSLLAAQRALQAGHKPMTEGGQICSCATARMHTSATLPAAASALGAQGQAVPHWHDAQGDPLVLQQEGVELPQRQRGAIHQRRISNLAVPQHVVHGNHAPRPH